MKTALMKTTLVKTSLRIGVVSVMALWIGCGISEVTLDDVQTTTDQVEQRKREIEASKSELKAYLASDESIGFRSANESEGWTATLEAAGAKVAQAEKLLSETVQPIVEADDSGQEYVIWETINECKELIGGTRQALDLWPARRTALEKAKAGAASLRTGARQSVDEIDAELKQLDSRASAVKREFPEQSPQIDQLLTPLQARLTGARDALAELEAQYKAHTSNANPDYAVFAHQAAYINSSKAEVAKGAAATEARISELSHSYAKTLIDMKADYALTIRRQSWDNGVDYPSLHDYDYTRKVDVASFEHFDSIPGSLATFTKGFFGNDTTLLAGVEKQRWDALNIAPEESWPSGDDEAEFWLQEGKADYFHKYHVVENGELSETDWVPVDEAFFFANIDNLGMDVEAKPYGVFEADKMTHAAPPGIAYVGDPRYGRWENQGGGSVWTWIAPYLFYRSLFGSPWMYQRNEWNTWRSGYYGSRPYYGSSSSSPMYGTRSSRTQASTLSGSQFGRSGGFSRPAGSVRGAGPSSRGGGFGGSGK